MKILFGMYLDGVVWSNRSASIGEVRTGPLGLLSILETRLGLSKPSIHPVHRINEYLKRLEELDRESAWFHRSFSVDPWSTARQLLEWRDELVEAGWQGNPSATGSPRLAALADLEFADIPLSAGRPDRLREVISCLEQKSPMHIASICLKENVSMLPPVWQYVMNLLHCQGTIISGLTELVENGATNNLSCIQATMLGTAVQSVMSDSDDSLILLKTENEWEAAEHLALWLASDLNANNQVTIICGMDTSVLDQALRRHGLPCLGRSEPSRWREIQQILPLILANAWQPLDIHLLVELLSLTATPFPKWVCRYLLKAISKEPGVGGRAWNDALTQITALWKQNLADKGDDKAEENAREFVRGIQALLVEERFDPALGIPEDKLRERCQRIIDWLGWQLDGDPSLVEVVSQAKEVLRLSFGKGFVPRITLERMLDTVIGTGSTSQGINEEAAPWQVVDHPGQLVDPCGELVWWGFNDLASSIPTYWSNQERHALESVGVVLEEPKNYRRREAYSWQQGLMYSQRRFMAVHVARIKGEESYHHPYWDSIYCAAKQAAKSSSEEFLQTCLIRECKHYEHKKDWEFAGRKNALEKAPVIKSIQAESCHAVPASVISAPESLSYSQMSTMIGCPMKWALEYHGGLRLPESQMIPIESQMIGTFCHRIIEEIYAAGSQMDAFDASRMAGSLFDSLLPSMASVLLLDGYAIERQRYRSSIVHAVQQLVETINRLHMKVEKTEASLEAKIDNIPFVGSADLLLRDRMVSRCCRFSRRHNQRKGHAALGTMALLLRY